MRRFHSTLPLILAAALAVGLSACARSGPPAPVVYGSGGPAQGQSAERSDPERQAQGPRNAENRTIDRSGRSSAPSEPRRRETQRESTTRSSQRDSDGASSGRAQQPTRQTAAEVNWARTGRAGLHTVAKGDSVYGLARRYQVPIRAIIDANDLEPPYTLYVGQEVRIPVPRRHVVERGDTVYGISRIYGVDMSELTRLNDIQPPYEIAPGQVLVIPGRGQDAAPTRTAGQGDGDTAPAGSGSGPANQTQTSEQRAQQRERADRDTAAIAGLPDAPAGTPIPPATPARKAERSAQTQTAQTQQTETGERSQSRDRQRQASAQPAAAPQPKSIPQPPPRAESRFLWPVRGKVLSRFGPMEGGLHNDGINIAAPAGTPIKAAENGVVAYVGNELRGFGNLLLIKHADGWVTAYAHAQEILVSHGQQVKRGQIVARVGATGSVSEPQLHFEVRKGSKAKDPAQLLGSQQASR